jgi:hypothetical protein
VVRYSFTVRLFHSLHLAGFDRRFRTLLVIFLLIHSVDERILGGGDFVDELKQHVELQTKMQSTVTLARLLEVVSAWIPRT